MSKLNDIFINGLVEEYSKVDFEEIYRNVSETRSYDRNSLRRYCLLGIYISDEKKQGHLIPILGHYETLLRDDDYTLLLEEVQRIIVTLNRVNRPETNINRLYM